MSNEIYVTMRGNVVGEPRHVQLREGVAVTSFRFAVTPRRFDRGREGWVDRETVWCTVNCWRGLAANVAASVHKGQPVVVYGRLSERTWSSDERTGHSIEIEADTVGHDLVLGAAEFTRANRSSAQGGEFRSGDPFEADGLNEPPVPEMVEVPGLPEAGDGTSVEPLGSGEGFPGLVVPDEEPDGSEPEAKGRPATRRRAKAAVA